MVGLTLRVSRNHRPGSRHESGKYQKIDDWGGGNIRGLDHALSHRGFASSRLSSSSYSLLPSSCTHIIVPACLLVTLCLPLQGRDYRVALTRKVPDHVDRENEACTRAVFVE